MLGAQIILHPVARAVWWLKQPEHPSFKASALHELQFIVRPEFSNPSPLVVP